MKVGEGREGEAGTKRGTDDEAGEEWKVGGVTGVEVQEQGE